MSRFTQMCILMFAVSPLSALAQDVMYITTNNAGILRYDAGGWSTFVSGSGYKELLPNSTGGFLEPRDSHLFPRGRRTAGIAH